jgi:hypothetical protein
MFFRNKPEAIAKLGAGTHSGDEVEFPAAFALLAFDSVRFLGGALSSTCSSLLNGVCVSAGLGGPLALQFLVATHQ